MDREATIFTKLTLRNAYHMVMIREGDDWKTTFCTPSDHFEYLVKPLGLTSALPVFQALDKNVLWDMLNLFVFVYLDDVFIFWSGQEHIQPDSLFVKANKFVFHVPMVSFPALLWQWGISRWTFPRLVQSLSGPNPVLANSCSVSWYLLTFKSLQPKSHWCSYPCSHFSRNQLPVNLRCRTRLPLLTFLQNSLWLKETMTWATVGSFFM